MIESNGKKVIKSKAKDKGDCTYDEKTKKSKKTLENWKTPFIIWNTKDLHKKKRRNKIG